MKKSVLLGFLVFLVTGLSLFLGIGCGNEVLNEEVLNDEAAITLFLFKAADNDALSSDYAATINGTDITVTVPDGTVVSALKGTAVCSAGASCSPDPKAAADYSAQMTLTVTAEDGETAADYTVTVAHGEPPLIAAFSFKAADNSTRISSDISGTVDDAAVAVTVPYATDINGLIPSITIDGEKISPPSGAPQDFRNDIVYTVIGADGKIREYTATVTIDDPPSQVPVFKTGQTTSYLTGDDGDLQAGREWPSPRFTDNGDGTITDHMTGLMWQQDPDENVKTWADALTYAAGSTLGDYGNWRVPNVLEMASLFNYDTAWASPNTQADWLESVGFSTAVSHDRWWTSTTVAGDTDQAYSAYIDSGGNAARIDADLKTDETHYRAIIVRGASAVLPKTGAGSIGGYTLVTGEDGDLRMGVPWPSPRFTENGDNTVTDNLTGLVWEQTVSTNATNLEGALGEANLFSDGGHLDWRLPNIRELMTLAHFGEADMDDWLNSSGFSDVVGGSAPGDFPWSSTREPGSDPSVAGMALTWGNSTFPLYNFGNGIGAFNAIAWPVRGGE